jgi:hypothetical protein
MALQLEEDKGAILRLVQLKMDRIAPNLSAAVGTEIAAQLMGVAGGLISLSKMPACNVQVGGRVVGDCARVSAAVASSMFQLPASALCLRPDAVLPSVPQSHRCSQARRRRPPSLPASHPVQVLGAKRKNLAGFSSTTAQPHQGFISASDIIQQTPPSLRSKAARLVGAKCTLLARIDAYGQVWPPAGAGPGREGLPVASTGSRCRPPLLPQHLSPSPAGPQRRGGAGHEGGDGEED